VIFACFPCGSFALIVIIIDPCHLLFSSEFSSSKTTPNSESSSGMIVLAVPGVGAAVLDGKFVPHTPHQRTLTVLRFAACCNRWMGGGVPIEDREPGTICTWEYIPDSIQNNFLTTLKSTSMEPVFFSHNASLALV